MPLYVHAPARYFRSGDVQNQNIFRVQPMLGNHTSSTIYS